MRKKPDFYGFFTKNSFSKNGVPLLTFSNKWSQALMLSSLDVSPRHSSDSTAPWSPTGKGSSWMTNTTDQWGVIMFFLEQFDHFLHLWIALPPRNMEVKKWVPPIVVHLECLWEEGYFKFNFHVFQWTRCTGTRVRWSVYQSSDIPKGGHSFGDLESTKSVCQTLNVYPSAL